MDGPLFINLLRLGLSEPHMSVCPVCEREAVVDFDVLLKRTDTVETVGHCRFCTECEAPR